MVCDGSFSLTFHDQTSQSRLRRRRTYPVASRSPSYSWYVCACALALWSGARALYFHLFTVLSSRCTSSLCPVTLVFKMGKTRKNFYAVRVGREVGVYNTWWVSITFAYESALFKKIVQVMCVCSTTISGQSVRLKWTSIQEPYSKDFQLPPKLNHLSTHPMPGLRMPLTPDPDLHTVHTLDLTTILNTEKDGIVENLIVLVAGEL